MTEAPGVTTPALWLARIALGCGNFGGVGSAPEFFGQGLSQDQALAVMDAAWQAGITHFDTADAYGGGRSEASIGHWIATRGVRPQLTTKTYNPMAAGADRGLAPGRIARQLRSSLDRLGVDHVELYLAHDFDPDVPLADTFGAFEQVEQARIAIHKLDHQRNHALQSLGQAHVARHEPADLLQQPKLLFGVFELPFEFLNSRHAYFPK